MTPKEKAINLVDKYSIQYNGMFVTIEYAKQCALIAVDEILNAIEKVFTPAVAKLNSTYIYWQQVKTEIENL